MRLIKLDYWTIIGDKLFGSIYNHPSIMDGAFIISSKIDRREGDLVYTQKAVYQLLRPF